MPWRRFRVFIDERLGEPEEEELYPPIAAQQQKFDWNAELDRAMGKEPPRRRNIMTIDEYMAGGS